MPTHFIDTNARLLNQLLTKQTVSASSVKSQMAQSLFEHLQHINIIIKQRKGGGNQYHLINIDALQAFIAKKYPAGLNKVEADIPARISGVFQSQDSKTQKMLDFTLLTIRGTALLNHANKIHDLKALTNADTSLNLKISLSQWCELADSRYTIVTVENPTAFIELEKILSRPWQLAVYTAGKMSNILLAQLQRWHQCNHRIIHFGDYDYVGLLEFSRILSCCSTARLYYPDTLLEQIQQYGNAKLLENQIAQHKTLLKQIEQLLDSNGKKELLEVYELLKMTAKGLEQEGLYACW